MDAHLAEAREVAKKQGRLVAFRIEFVLRAEEDFAGRNVGLDRRFVRREVVEGEGDRLEAFVVGRRRRDRLGCCGLRRGSDRLGRRRLGRGRHFTVCKGLELSDQRLAAGLIDATAIAGGIGEVRQHIRRLQHDLQHILRGLQLVGAHAIERRLEDMGEGYEIIETEGSGTALDRVDGAEHGVDRLGITVAVVQFQETGFQLGELLLALLEKDLFDFVHIHRERSSVRRLRARLHR